MIRSLDPTSDVLQLMAGEGKTGTHRTIYLPGIQYRTRMLYRISQYLDQMITDMSHHRPPVSLTIYSSAGSPRAPWKEIINLQGWLPL